MFGTVLLRSYEIPRVEILYTVSCNFYVNIWKQYWCTLTGVLNILISRDHYTLYCAQMVSKLGCLTSRFSLRPQPVIWVRTPYMYMSIHMQLAPVVSVRLDQWDKAVCRYVAQMLVCGPDTGYTVPRLDIWRVL